MKPISTSSDGCNETPATTSAKRSNGPSGSYLPATFDAAWADRERIRRQRALGKSPSEIAANKPYGTLSVRYVLETINAAKAVHRDMARRKAEAFRRAAREAREAARKQVIESDPLLAALRRHHPGREGVARETEPSPATRHGFRPHGASPVASWSSMGDRQA